MAHVKLSRVIAAAAVVTVVVVVAAKQHCLTVLGKEINNECTTAYVCTHVYMYDVLCYVRLCVSLCVLVVGFVFVLACCVIVEAQC